MENNRDRDDLVLPLTPTDQTDQEEEQNKLKKDSHD
jgi:hypothetical protein